VTLRLFVYGTLVPGRAAWEILEPWVVGTPESDAVAGRLYDTGRGYPAATFSGGDAGDDSPGVVHGTVVVLDPERAPAALADLDHYEGPEYRRVTVRTERGVEAAAYAWIAPLTGCRAVDGGHWADWAHTESRREDGR